VHPAKKIRVGIMLNGLSTTAWAYEMLQEISAGDYAEICLVILNGDKGKKKKYTFAKFRSRFNYLLSYVYEGIDRKLFKTSPDAFESVKLTDFFRNTATIEVIPESKGLSQWFSPHDIAEIKKNNIDVLIRLGFSILKGDILHATPYGIWSLHHGDNKVNRGGPPGFWEMYLNQPVTGTILQVLSEDLDNGLVLSKTWGSTHKYSLSISKNSFYWKSGKLFTRRLKELHQSGFEKLKQAHHHDFYFYDRTKYTRPTNSQVLRFLLKLSWKVVSRALPNLFRRNQWFLMYGLRKDGSMVQSMHKLKKIIPPADRFWADPFVVYKDETYYIFIEEKFSSAKCAHISVIEMDGKGNYSQPRKVLDTGYHLSYPFVFEYEGNRYMMPETTSRKTIEVFKCIRFPDQWELHKTIFENIKAVDPTLFFHDHKWWLFAAVADGSSVSRNDELFIYFSDSPFGPWRSHPENPVVSDVRRARPAGKIFRYRNKIYRPSQDCSVTYGYALRMNEIITLNETSYLEQEVDFIEPLWNEDLNGTHTFCFEHNLTMIDGVRKRWK
jgi:hypothetical protein